jgi:hypothetical protein
MELGERGKGKENDTASVISQNLRHEVEDIGCVLKAVEKWSVGGKGGVRKSNGRG